MAFQVRGVDATSLSISFHSIFSLLSRSSLACIHSLLPLRMLKLIFEKNIQILSDFKKHKQQTRSNPLRFSFYLNSKNS